MLAGSSILHIFWCKSSKACSICTKINYLGISAMIVGSDVPIVYDLFFCRPKFIYLSLVSAAAVSCSVVTVFQTPRFRLLLTLFSRLGLTG